MPHGQRNHPRRADRVSRFQGSDFKAAYFVEAVVIIEGVGILMVKAEWEGWATIPVAFGREGLFPAPQQALAEVEVAGDLLVLGLHGILEVAVAESLKVPARVWRDLFAGLLEDEHVARLDSIENRASSRTRE